MNNLLIHPLTQAHIDRFLLAPKHALLLIGANGIGKRTVAEQITSKVLGLKKPLDEYPYFKAITPEKDTISIDAIRELQRFLQLKTTGTNPVRRAVIIEHAEGLSIEAQNAFLKLLEEPPLDTLLLLTVNTKQSLQPTILSRTASLQVHPPTEDAIRKYFEKSGKSSKDITQSYFMSGGLPGLMHALLNDSDHPLLAAITAAKKILQGSTFERLAIVEALSKRKDDAKYTLEALQHIAETALYQAAGNEVPAKIKQWHHILKVTTEARTQLAANANVKLTLDNLMLSLR